MKTLLRTCDSMNKLNHLAGGGQHWREIYRLKDFFIAYLYEHGYCIECHLEKQILPHVTYTLLSYTFQVGDWNCFWHQPLNRKLHEIAVLPKEIGVYCKQIPIEIPLQEGYKEFHGIVSRFLFWRSPRYRKASWKSWKSELQWRLLYGQNNLLCKFHLHSWTQGVKWCKRCGDYKDTRDTILAEDDFPF